MRAAPPDPPALLPWPPRLRASVAGTHPRLPGELSPWPPKRQVCSLLRLSSRALAGDAPPLTVSRGPHVHGSREVPLAGASDGSPVSSYELFCEGTGCGRGDSNSHPVKPGLGPQPSASANSATSARPARRSESVRATRPCGECRGGDSNSHERNAHSVLSAARLPVPPPRPVSPGGLEPPTFWTATRRSNPLSYGDATAFICLRDNESQSITCAHRCQGVGGP